ncbi:MAG: DUF1343 domain-containing protein [Chitinophagales bacterium]|nr:DUF1343 domain-containing protein [Chitinophagales bacterium]MDW8393004.1 DUF1343 domain-containing protein [Chitinophagales bacterium]
MNIPCRKWAACLPGLLLSLSLHAQPEVRWADSVVTGAERTESYWNLLRGRNVALVVNHSARIGTTHLADSLLRAGISVKKIFSPEHGFRGLADAGMPVPSSRDEQTGLPVLSLYGKNYKPTTQQLQDVDVVVYDIQDVGVRFYTYLSTLHYVMEACAENNKPLIVLDRPNPNGFYVDGPVLDTAFRSFVGMHPVPVVYGMTVGEYARMINGEGWLAGNRTCSLTVIPCRNYDHSMLYPLPVPPSPNLRSLKAVLAYPSLCFFEGTPVSVGRGTEKPFLLFGYPGYRRGSTLFIPQPMAGATAPPYSGQEVHGHDLSILTEAYFYERRSINLYWLMDMYQSFPDKSRFFLPFFNKLAGTNLLQQQIRDGLNEAAIRETWKPQLEAFREIRKKYLLYPDFE